MHACDRQTDRWTDRITTPKTALAYGRAVKIVHNLAKHNYKIKGVVFMKHGVHVYTFNVVILRLDFSN